MTSLSAEARRQRLLRKFHHSGDEGMWTRPFDGFPADVRENLLHVAAIQEGELPVLSYFRDPRHWVLLTTERVVAWRPEGLLSLRWSDIEDATVDATQANETLASSPNGKLALNRLKLLLQGGKAVELELEPGASFVGFWSALKMVAALRHT